MTKKWQLFETDEEKVEKYANKFNLNKLLATIIVNRNIKEDEIETFLKPTRYNFHDPFLMPDMEKAVERIIRAIKNKEKVIIYGDYDVDGITSTTILKSFLKERGLDVGEYIPNRLEEGYGLNKNAIDKIVSEKYTLMITVDCGITANEEIEYAKQFSLETIVTDHHEPGEKIPNILAVIDCKRKDNSYPFRELAGCGVAFKLCQAISKKLNLDDKEYLKYLDIACIGTISDIVPLVDENRTIAKLGLMLVNQTKNIGLKSIINSSGYKNINSETISFGIAPRINACGRMGHALDALDLFMEKNVYEVNALTNKLNEYNKIRQDIEKNIYSEALKQIEEENLDKNNTIVVSGNNWHHGVIGIVSSKITEKYFKPSILLSNDDGLLVGSGRSIPGFDLHNALMKCMDTIEKFGGHAMAIGVTLKKENLNKFKEELEEEAKEQNTDKIEPIINIDSKIDLSKIDKEMVKSLKLLEPFGEGNKIPNFLFKNLKIVSIRTLSEGKHLKMSLQDNNILIDAIGFNLGNLIDDYLIGNKIDVVGTLEINNFNGIDSIQINVKDMMKSL